jgi:hypothetical protein
MKQDNMKTILDRLEKAMGNAIIKTTRNKYQIIVRYFCDFLRSI